MTALVLVLTACLNTIGGRPTAPADLAWERNVTDAVANMGGVLMTVGHAMTEVDYSATRDNCTKLQAALDRIEDQLPAPDKEVDDALRDGIDNYRSFADICVTLTPSSSGSDLDRLTDYLDRGDARIRDALDLIGIEIPRR